MPSLKEIGAGSVVVKSDLPHPTWSAEEFSIGQARRIVSDLFGPRPAIYYADFLTSMFVGVFCFAAIERGYLFNWICSQLGWGTLGYAGLVVVFFAIQCLAFYRAALFTHELVHLKEGAVPGFRVVWNALCGVPFFMPSFLYQTHVHHHIRKHYGTKADGEYLPLASGPVWGILSFVSQSFVIPLIAAARFTIITPLSWLSPAFRRWVLQHASAMICDPTYIRPLPTAGELRQWRRQEIACLIYGWAAVGLIASGVLPWTILIHAYGTGVTIILLNAIRTLGAHRYRCTGHEVSFLEQLLDSVNYPRNAIFAELWAPVGLRFHATHHLFPSLPYHALGQAHRRLMQELPHDSPYRQTEVAGLWSVLSQLWREARASSALRAPTTPTAAS